MKKLFYVLFLMLTSASLVVAQVEGVVKDAQTGDALIGVNVTKAGAGTTTVVAGDFKIAAEVGDTLGFSYIGYTTLKLPVSAEFMEVQLSQNSEMLEEVIVVGYGAVGKKDLTGVVNKVSEGDFVQGSNSSPERLLVGKVPGLQISNNGEPGGGNKIRLRGGTSLDASTSPLIVVDGVPLDSRTFASSRNPLNFINQADVESMTVLKDASAAAIYGSRGANGVIIITTKSGEKGKTKLSYSGNANVSLFNGPNN